MSAVLRIKEINKTRTRKQKLKKLRARYAILNNEEDREKIILKIKRIAPWLSKEEFLAPIEAK